MPRRVKKTVNFSNLDKRLFPTGFTKGAMVQYYIDVAPYLLPHLCDRPITLIRFPNGTRGESFYEKNAPGFAPDWIQTCRVPRREHAGEINYILVNDAETLAWCANLAAIEFHPFLHRAANLDRPTHVAFDLDPGEGADLLTCADVAFQLKQLFDTLGLASFPKVSGSKGLQVYVPLNTPTSYAVTQAFAKAVAELLAREHPKQIVSEMPKGLRTGRVFIDWSQNSAAKTTVAVYSLRAKRDQPYVSAPVGWPELERARRKGRSEGLMFAPDAVLARLKKTGDLFAPVLKLKQRLPAAFTKLPPAPAESSLRRYAGKRDFTRTSEPKPVALRRRRQGSARRFVIQKHAASHLHYDFRLEMGDTLKSWAIPKGVPYELGVKRSAFQVEDHPIAYLNFEGTIPAGQYGGGTVMVWDIGTYDLIGGDYGRGDLKLWLEGRKLKGEWHLFRIKSEEDKPVWLIQKARAPMRPLTPRQEDQSVLTRRSMARIASDNDAQWQSNRPDGGRRRAAPDQKPAGGQPAPTTREKSTDGAGHRAAGPGTDEPTSRGRHGRAGGASPTFIEPMQPMLVDTLPDGPEWCYEVKWDGFRALAIKTGKTIRLLSRRRKSLAAEFPTVMRQLGTVRADSFLIDGEIVALGRDGKPSFHALQNRGSEAIVFYAFDLLFRDGADFAAEPLERRQEELADLLAGSDLLRSVVLPGAAATVLAAVRKLGLEGVVAKRRSASYTPGERSDDWRKVRLMRGQEFVIGGFKPGLKPFESVLVGYHDAGKLRFAGKVRAGFTARSRAAVWKLIESDLAAACPFADLPDANQKGRWGEGITAADMKELRWVKPRHAVRVAFTEWTQHGHLRHAAFEGLRPDKRARDVVRESA